MKIIYGIIIILLIILLGACALKAKSKKGNLARIVFLYETGAVLFGITFMIFTFSNNIKVVTFCRGLMFAGYDWLLILLMYYTQYYTGLFDEVRIIKEAMVIYGMFDTVLLFSNIWTGQLFSFEFITDAELHLRFTDSIFVKIHFIYNFAIVLLLLVSYMFMIMKSSKFYRIRYEVIFASLFIAAVLDIIFFKSNSVYDISVVAFGLMSVFIYYFTLSYVPEELIENTLSLVIKDMNSGIICFDNRGKCIHCNDYIKKVFSLCDEYSELETGYHRWLEKIADKRENNIEYSAVKVVDGESKNYDVIYKRIFDDKNIKEYNPEKYWDYNLNSSDDGVECLTDLFERCQNFLDDIIIKNKDKKILIVSHASVIRCMHHILRNTDLNNEKLHIPIPNSYFEVVKIPKSIAT